MNINDNTTQQADDWIDSTTLYQMIQEQIQQARTTQAEINRLLSELKQTNKRSHDENIQRHI